MSNSFAQTLVRFALRTLIGLVLTVVVLAGLYLLFAYHFTYSRGESVGDAEKLS
jgi:type IV secretory pathway TrbL component